MDAVQKLRVTNLEYSRISVNEWSIEILQNNPKSTTNHLKKFHSAFNQFILYLLCC